MTVAEQMNVIRRCLTRADGGFVGDFAESFTPDYQGQVAGRIHMDLAGLIRLERGFAEASGDTVRTVEDLRGAGDKGGLRRSTRAVHRGAFNGIAATGRSIVFCGMVIDRFRDGRIAESRGELESAGLWQQLTSPAA